MLAAFAVAALIATVVGVLWFGGAVSARHRAQAAADLAALAAAQRLAAGPESACRQAAIIAESMGALVRGCQIDALDVVVIVEVPVGAPVHTDARASARAGPG